MRSAPPSLCQLAAVWARLSKQLWELVPSAGPQQLGTDAGAPATRYPLPVGLLFLLAEEQQRLLLDAICTDLTIGNMENLWQLATAANTLAAVAAGGWPLDGLEAPLESTADDDDSSRRHGDDKIFIANEEGEEESGTAEAHPTEDEERQRRRRRGDRVG